MGRKPNLSTPNNGKSLDGIVRRAPTRRKPNRLASKKYITLALVTVLIAGSVVYAIYGLVTKSGNDNSPNASLDGTITAVSQHYVLPIGETPTLATITDKTKLTNALKNKAENGDRVLIYQENQTAILYRPSIDRVIDVTSVSIDTPKNGIK